MLHLLLFSFKYPNCLQYKTYKTELMNLIGVLHFSSRPKPHSHPPPPTCAKKVDGQKKSEQLFICEQLLLPPSVITLNKILTLSHGCRAFAFFPKLHRGDLYKWPGSIIGHARQMLHGGWAGLELTEPLPKWSTLERRGKGNQGQSAYFYFRHKHGKVIQHFNKQQQIL